MTRKLAVAALVVAALAIQAAVLQLAIVAPLGNAIGELRAAARPATFEESITVVAARPHREPGPANRS